LCSGSANSVANSVLASVFPPVPEAQAISPCPAIALTDWIWLGIAE